MLVRAFNQLLRRLQDLKSFCELDRVNRIPVISINYLNI